MMNSQFKEVRELADTLMLIDARMQELHDKLKDNPDYQKILELEKRMDEIDAELQENDAELLKEALTERILQKAATT